VEHNYKLVTPENSSIEFIQVESTDGCCGIHTGRLREQAGALSFDNGFNNTASCRSAITYIDGEKGILRHRGYDIESLAENCTSTEIAYLLVHGKLPSETEQYEFSAFLNDHSLIHEDMQHFFTGLPQNSHPMSTLSAMVNTLSSFYPHIMTGDRNSDEHAYRTFRHRQITWLDRTLERDL
jgi:citrate synthase